MTRLFKPAIHWNGILVLLCGGCATSISLSLLSNGFTLSPDGWTYWECSVSMLTGDGYSFFGGQPIEVFPPLFPLYLAATQWLFGVGASTVIGSVALLAGVTASIWCNLLLLLSRRMKKNIVASILAAIFLSAFVGVYFTYVLSETLLLPLLGLLLTAVFHWNAPTARWPHLGGMWFLATLMLLTRNSATAFIPGFALAIFLKQNARDNTERRSLLSRLATAAATMLVPLSFWFTIRGLLGQLGSHPIGTTANFTPTEYAVQLFNDLSIRLGPETLFIGWILLGTSVVLIAIAVCSSRITVELRSLLLMNGIGVVVLFVLFNVTWINDPLSGRFLWFVPMTLVIALVPLSWPDDKRPSPVAITVLLLISMVQVQRTSEHVWRRFTQPVTHTVLPSYTIHPDHMSKPPETVGKQILISPPEFSARIDREFDVRDD